MIAFFFNKINKYKTMAQNQVIGKNKNIVIIIET